MGEGQLAETTLMLSRRVLRRCTIQDADAEAATETVDVCMGSAVGVRQVSVNERTGGLDPDLIDA